MYRQHVIRTLVGMADHAPLIIQEGTIVAAHYISAASTAKMVSGDHSFSFLRLKHSGKGSSDFSKASISCLNLNKKMGELEPHSH